MTSDVCASYSITCSTQDGTVSDKSVPPKTERFSKWWGRQEARIITDNSVSDAAFRVYAVLTLKTSGNLSSIGMRELGRIVNKSPQTVMRRLQELESHGLIKAVKGDIGQRSRYELISTLFIPKDKSVSKHARRDKPAMSPTVRQAMAFANLNRESAA